MSCFFQGLTMGLAYVAPIGLRNLFVINSALTQSRHRAFLTALIVIFFDISLALACFFGIGALMEHYSWLEKIVLLAGSLMVLYIGIGLVRARTEDLDRSGSGVSVRKTITTACVVTWFNPQAIIDGTMMLGAFRVTLPAAQSTPFIVGVALASCLWFSGITVLISAFADRFNAKVLRWINIICGVVILFYGCKLLVHFIGLVA